MSDASRGDSVATAAATATTLCDDIGDISGFTRRVTGSARIARFRSIGLHPVAMMTGLMTGFLSVLLHGVAGCLARCILCKHGRRASKQRGGGKRDYCEFHSLLHWIARNRGEGAGEAGACPDHGPARLTWPDD
jgi:hypothetical protein